MKNFATIACMLSLLIMTACQTERPASATFTSPLSIRDRYCAGGGGNYQVDIPCWRDWDASWNYLPGVSGRPAFKFWTMGKFDNRIDSSCMPGSHPIVVREITDAIFNCEKTKIAALIQAGWTGQWWEIGNEPNLYPVVPVAEYAYQFNLYKTYIMSLDPAAKFLNGGLAQNTEWWGYVSNLIDLGVAPDAWDIHPYNLALSADESKTQIVSFRNLIGEGKPIWIGEFGWGSWSYRDPNEIAAYLDDMCGWLNVNGESLGIDRWFWWGILAGSGGMGSGGLHAGSPYTYTNATVVGQTYYVCRQRYFEINLPYIRK